MRSRLVIVGSAVMVMGLTLLSAGAATAVTPGSVVPDQDPFYAAPANISSYQPGQVVDSRPVTQWLFGGPSAVDSWQISYRSNDSHNAPELAVTTLVVPKSQWSGVGQRPAVSYQVPEDSTGTQCAPSYTLASGTGALAAPAGALLAAGYAVAIPDHEGPKSVFLAGPQEGHAVLDGIRAVKNFNHAGVGGNNPWALDGYSGGANATAWAAELQQSYAPDVTLVGASMGGTPADPAEVARSIDGGSASGFEFAAAQSIAEEWPESGIRDLLNAKGVAAFADVEGKCTSEILVKYPFKKLSDYTTAPDPLAVPSVAAVLTIDTLGAAAPTIPVYNYHADTDEIVPVAQDNTMVASWCAKGATVQKVRDAVGEHGEEAAVRLPSVLDFLAGQFAGRTPISTC